MSKVYTYVTPQITHGILAGEEEGAQRLLLLDLVPEVVQTEVHSMVAVPHHLSYEGEVPEEKEGEGHRSVPQAEGHTVRTAVVVVAQPATTGLVSTAPQYEEDGRTEGPLGAAADREGAVDDHKDQPEEVAVDENQDHRREEGSVPLVHV